MVSFFCGYRGQFFYLIDLWQNGGVEFLDLTVIGDPHRVAYLPLGGRICVLCGYLDLVGAVDFLRICRRLYKEVGVVDFQDRGLEGV